MLDDLIKERIKKRDALAVAGYDAYPARVKKSHTIAEVIVSFAAFEKGKKRISLVGRIVGMRGHGGVLFLDLRDISGDIQIVAKKDSIKNFEVLRDNLDIGDFINATGTLFVTQKGERSVLATQLVVATKSLRPLPSSEHYAIEDVETRLRKRYLDLLSHPELKRVFEQKARFWHTFRELLCANGFMEVETPVLESLPGGADAEPFATHHNALDVDLYLRIALELPQKKLLVAGFEKIFEIGRIFRNEGIDHEHLQDYTQLEFYWAYQDYIGLMKFTELLYKTVVQAVLGKTTSVYQGQKIAWGKKWHIFEYYDLFQKYVGLDLHTVTRDALAAEVVRRNIDYEPTLGRGRLIDLLYKKLVRPTLIQPCFLVNPPVDIEPLAKRSVAYEDRVERFQVMACGTELGKGFSELNDPAEQRARFGEQMRLREHGDKEAQRLDEDFLEALEYGMPPAAGFGMSERLFAILMDKPVRETVFFPLMRPK